MTDENGLCTKLPRKRPQGILCDAARSSAVCVSLAPIKIALSVTLIVINRKTEEEAYWAEIEENVFAGRAEFRDPREPHIY